MTAECKVCEFKCEGHLEWDRWVNENPHNEHDVFYVLGIKKILNTPEGRRVFVSLMCPNCGNLTAQICVPFTKEDIEEAKRVDCYERG